MGQQEEPETPKGESVMMELPVTLEDLYLGKTYTVRLRKGSDPGARHWTGAVRRSPRRATKRAHTRTCTRLQAPREHTDRRSRGTGAC